MPSSKYTLRLKTICRISAVDRPAQPTAAVRLIKRDDSAKSAPVDFTAEFKVAKLDDDLRLVFGYAFTSTKDGAPYHDLQGDHVLSDDEMIKAALAFVTTGARADVMHDRLDHGGSVPFLMPMTPEIAKAFGLEGGEVGLMVGMRPDAETYAKFKDGTYTAFSIDGTGERELVTEKTTVDIQIIPATKSVPKEKENMPEVEDLKKNVDELNAKLSKAIAYGSLSDAEKKYHAALPDCERDAWLGKARSARAEDVNKAAEADAVVYKSERTGKEYRKSAGAELIDAVKAADEAFAAVSTEKALREKAELEKRADDEIGNFSGSVKARAALLKAVDSIADESVRKEVQESIKGADGTIKRMFETAGTWEREASPDSPQAKIEKLAHTRASEKGEAYGVAYCEVLKTAEGESLYNQLRAEQSANAS
jgi:hypothetical protein